MSQLVIDSSMAVKLALEPGAFGRLRRFELTSPPLLWSESVSALRELTWRGAVSSDLADVARDAFLTAPIERRSPRRLYAEAWQIAVDLGWAKTYDAEYLALARLQDCPLLTIDERLRRGGERAARVIGPTEL